jgi:hypothetical protein
MKNILLFLFIAVTFIGCGSGYQSMLSSDITSKIPNGANKVIITTGVTSDSLFNEVFSLLTDQNFRIATENKGLGYLSTEGKKIWESIFLRMSIKISRTNNGSKLIAFGESMLDASTMSTINSIYGTNIAPEWKITSRRDDGKIEVAYEKMILILQKITHERIEFVKE